MDDLEFLKSAWLGEVTVRSGYVGQQGRKPESVHEHFVVRLANNAREDDLHFSSSESVEAVLARAVAYTNQRLQKILDIEQDVAWVEATAQHDVQNSLQWVRVRQILREQLSLLQKGLRK